MTLRLRGLGALWLWLLPGALVGLFLIYVPLAAALGVGFLKMTTLASAPTFAWIENYVQALQSSEFWSALRNGLIYALGSLLLELLLGVCFALVLNQRFRGRALLRGIVIFPYVIPSAVGVMTWKWMLDENVGIITVLLRHVHIEIPWLSRPGWAMATVILISVWLWTPFVTVTTLAGLQTIPSILYEAAQVDGARALQRLWHITLPSLLPILVVVALLRGIFMFNKFDVIWLATGGGPLDSTEHLPILAYQISFGNFHLGQGAAVSGLNLLAVVFLVVVYLRATRRVSQQ
jgi:multiple sugar transport system permease protein